MRDDLPPANDVIGATPRLTAALALQFAETAAVVSGEAEGGRFTTFDDAVRLHAVIHSLIG